MECKSCIITEVIYEIKFQEEGQDSALSEIIEHLSRRRVVVNQEGNVLKIKESGVQDLFAFWTDHMGAKQAYFRMENQEWRPFTDLKQVLETQWIDEVIKEELITCFYQPIVNVNKEVYGYEILSRFQKEDGSLISPALVFEGAKDRGRLYALDRVCRMTAVKHAKVLKNKKAFINFIPTSIYSPEFCLKSTTKIADKLGIDPSQLVFEVVETEKVDDVDHLKRILTYYKEKGFKYALDDVGEGFSTIELLEDITPHYMKLDMQFVREVASDLNKQRVAKKFLEMAIKVGSIPLAEGVESQEDFDWLKQAGYQLFQGYFFGKPAPLPEGLGEKMLQ
ncbi:MAG: EAL domain-containing protein [Bacillus sp. (in: Bacteria)]|nr:EAL domain-containing protein [Bacillus sp. (in: firmicutes)]